MKFLFLTLFLTFSPQSWSLVEDHDLNNSEVKFLEDVRKETIRRVNLEKEKTEKNMLCLKNYQDFQTNTQQRLTAQVIENCSQIIKNESELNRDNVMSLIENFINKNKVLNSTYRLNIALYALRASPDSFYNQLTTKPLRALPNISLTKEEMEIAIQQVQSDQVNINEQWEEDFVNKVRTLREEQNHEKQAEIEKQLRAFVSERISPQPIRFNLKYPPLEQLRRQYQNIWRENLMNAQIASIRLYLNEDKHILFNNSAEVSSQSLIRAYQILLGHFENFIARLNKPSPNTYGFWGKVKYLYVPGQNLILSDYLNFKGSFLSISNQSDENRLLAKNLIERVANDHKTLEGQIMSWGPIAPYIVLGVASSIFSVAGSVALPAALGTLSSLIFVADASLYLIDSYQNLQSKKGMWVSDAISYEHYENSLSRFYFSTIVFGIAAIGMKSTIHSLSQNWKQISTRSPMHQPIPNNSKVISGHSMTDYCLSASHASTRMISKILPGGLIIQGLGNYLCYRAEWIIKRESSQAIVGFTDPVLFQFKGFSFIIAFARQVITYERLIYLEQLAKELSESI